MGMATTNTLERVLASFGVLDETKPPEFRECKDVPSGGVLFALPALLHNGLLMGIDKYFQLPKGYYGLHSLFMVLAFMLLARIKSIEGFRYEPPGEWGKLLGLDRIPEVKTLRRKIKILATTGQVKEWSAELSKDWMEDDPNRAGVLYMDGHCRVYHGSKANLPKHYITREKLCLRATSDYWINALEGAPLFRITKDIDSGLIQSLREDIVPRLLRDIPNQPSAEALQADPELHRFVLVFDREGWSPALFKELWDKHRIACLTYKKKPGEVWPKEDFIPTIVRSYKGVETSMKLAVKNVTISRVELREIRKLNDSGHQTSIITTVKKWNIETCASRMFARWCQENYFKYVRTHFSLDKLVEYGVENLPLEQRVVNPEYRRLDSEIKSTAGKLFRKQALFAQETIQGEIKEGKKVEEYEIKRGLLQEEIEGLQTELDRLKQERKAHPRHVPLSELSEEQRYQKLASKGKDFLDTIKMIAYRAETAMNSILMESLKSRECKPKDDIRSLLRGLYKTTVDIIPNEKAGTLRVKLHHMANKSFDDEMRYLCQELNDSKTLFPGTSLRLIFELVS